MKINVNAIGLGEVKLIRIGEGLILIGLVAAATGFILIKTSQCWTIGTTNEHIAYFKTVINELDSAFK
jgi:hypothetical protein